MRHSEEELSTVGWGVCALFPYEEIDYCDGRMSLPLMVAMMVLGSVTFFVNLGVIIRTVKILRHGHDNKPAFYFIGNLALSDLAIGLYVVTAFLLHVTKKSDLWQRSTCLLQIGVAVTACQETIFSIVLIAVDKYLYICHGLKYSFLVTSKRVYAALGVSWFLSVLIGSLPALGMQVSWEEACNRCVFAQVVSRNFAIVFFITSVAGPYAVVVSLYSVLLVLALKMQKTRYGGSYTVDPSARSSNLRLSLMSKKSSSVSSASSSSSSSLKANRRRRRRQEMAQYKASLPGATDRDASARLIHYAAAKGPGDSGLVAEEGKKRLQGEGILKEEEQGGGETKACANQVEDAAGGVANGVAEASGEAPPGAEGRSSEAEGDESPSEAGAEEANAEGAKGDLPAGDAADGGPDLPRETARVPWLPAKYLNRVVAETRDKVLFLKKCRAVKTVFLIVVSFTATYVPFVVGTLVYSLESQKQVCLLHALSTLLYCAVVANSLANPLIYAYGYREFRVKAKKFKGIFATEKPRRVL